MGPYHPVSFVNAEYQSPEARSEQTNCGATDANSGLYTAHSMEYSAAQQSTTRGTVPELRPFHVDANPLELNERLTDVDQGFIPQQGLDKKVTRACNRCRRSKIKCSEPVTPNGKCQPCSNRNESCVFEDVPVVTNALPQASQSMAWLEQQTQGEIAPQELAYRASQAQVMRPSGYGPEVTFGSLHRSYQTGDMPPPSNNGGFMNMQQPQMNGLGYNNDYLSFPADAATWVPLSLSNFGSSGYSPYALNTNPRPSNNTLQNSFSIPPATSYANQAPAYAPSDNSAYGFPQY